MILARTPFRVSFFGGGTDYPAWYRRHGGAVLAATIDKYCYLTCRHLPPFFEHRIRVVYSKIETCWSVDEIQHPAVRAVLQYLRIHDGLEIHHDGDLPARSGMGSSSAFTVGLLHALHALQGQMVSKTQLAQEGIEVEQELLRESVGSQDQVLAAHGGLNHVRFDPDGSIAVQPVTIAAERLDELNRHLMLFFTGVQRTASDVASSYVGNLDAYSPQLHQMHRMVDRSLEIVRGSEDLEAFGELLHEGWRLKRTMGRRISSDYIDDLYQRARDAGAIGGKLLGAGGGGFLLLFVRPENQSAVRQRLQGLVHVPFRLEHSGSQILLFDPETRYRDEEWMNGGRRAAMFDASPIQEALGTMPAAVDRSQV